jgi:hypothetical protein
LPLAVAVPAKEKDLMGVHVAKARIVSKIQE